MISFQLFYQPNWKLKNFSNEEASTDKQQKGEETPTTPSPENEENFSNDL
jgi:hypothetical protein